jgi:hypothetical protein
MKLSGNALGKSRRKKEKSGAGKMFFGRGAKAVAV